MRLLTDRAVSRNPVSIRAASRANTEMEEATRRGVPLAHVQRERAMQRGKQMDHDAARRAKSRQVAVARKARAKLRRAKLDRYLNDMTGSDLERDTSRHTMESVARRVCWLRGITISELKAGNRRRDLVFARACFCYWARKLTDRSLPQIAQFLGHRHHTTIMHAAHSYPIKRRRTNPNWRGVGLG